MSKFSYSLQSKKDPSFTNPLANTTFQAMEGRHLKFCTSLSEDTEIAKSYLILMNIRL